MNQLLTLHGARERLLDARWRVDAAMEKIAKLRARYYLKYAFVHINKTGGSSVEQALGLPFQHKTALELRDEMGAARWQRRFTFTIVRNPWDRAVSHFYYRVMTNQTGLGDGHLGFDEWVERVYVDRDPKYHDQPSRFMPQLDWITDADGKVLVEMVGRYESLERDFAQICKRIEREASLPRLKASRRPHYREAYNDRSAEIVAQWFAKDIAAFEYSF